MRKVLFISVVLMVLSLNFASSEIIHPMEFQGSEEEYAAVNKFIKSSVKESYTRIGMGEPWILRMMEKEEIRSYKELSKVSNLELLDSIIQHNCDIDTCNYGEILMMYKEQNTKGL